MRENIFYPQGYQRQMARAPTLEKYSELLLALIGGGYKVTCVADFLEKPSRGSVAVIIHPVGKSPERAAAMALAEKRLGIRATYYFCWDPKAVNWAGAGEERYGNFPELQVTEARLYGHEVGYLSLPKEDAASRLARLRELAPVRTALGCESEDLMGGPDASPEFSDFARFSDAGKRWSPRMSTDELIALLRSKKHARVMLTAHPENWKR